MPGTAKKRSLLPVLLTTSDTLAGAHTDDASILAVRKATRSLSATTADGAAAAASSNDAAKMSADAFEEDWQRPPGDTAYLQDLLESLERPSQHLQTLATNTTTTATITTPNVKMEAPTATRRSRNGDAAWEADVASFHRREKQITVIEGRRRRAQHRCDAVDAAFARSVERRMQAMQHLALDPPAERLVGQGVTQYVPAALLPDDVLDEKGRLRSGPLPLLPHSVVETHVRQQLMLGHSSPAAEQQQQRPVTVITDSATRQTNGADALVFLTQLDAGGARESGQEERTGDTSTSSPHPSTSAAVSVPSRTHHGGLVTSGRGGGAVVSAERALAKVADDDDDSDGDEEAWMRPSSLTAANKDRWRELGYHVVVVGGAYGAEHSTTTTRGGERTGARRAFRSTAAPLEASASLSTAVTTFEGGARQPSSANSPTSRASAGRHGNASSSSSRVCGGIRGEGPLRWTTLAPLPPVCLIQRRLPEEDLKAAELRDRRSSSRRASRRRPAAGGGDDGHTWKTGGK
jgi:hypothetical protein